jgi:hypothetical protein
MQIILRPTARRRSIVFQKTDALIKEHFHPKAEECPASLRDKEQVPEGTKIRNQISGKP